MTGRRFAFGMLRVTGRTRRHERVLGRRSTLSSFRTLHPDSRRVNRRPVPGHFSALITSSSFDCHRPLRSSRCASRFFALDRAIDWNQSLPPGTSWWCPWATVHGRSGPDTVELRMAGWPNHAYIGTMPDLTRIVVDPSIRFGKPTVRGSRLTVGEVLEHLASGMTESEFLREFPQLSHEDILACLAFAAARERRTAILSD